MGLSNKTVLIVDDSPSMRKMVSFAMKKVFKFGSEFQASDGLEALDMISKEHIDLVICDINMPNMNGLEFLTKVKNDEAFKEIPVVMLSTESKQEDIIKAINLGANAYVKKPFKPEEMKKALMKINIL
ncbi:MAG: response regulator [Nitrospinae bacterium]|nr:response regulator [Nitrospinota bacterium]